MRVFQQPLLASHLIPELPTTGEWCKMRHAYLEFVYQHPDIDLSADEEG